MSRRELTGWSPETDGELCGRPLVLSPASVHWTRKGEKGRDSQRKEATKRKWLGGRESREFLFVGSPRFARLSENSSYIAASPVT
jgi:hypothetical protein